MTTLKKYKTRFEKKIKIPEFSTTYHPGNNFYMYINDNWLKTTHIPEYESSYSVNEEIDSIIEDDLFLILNKSLQLAKKGEKQVSFNNKLKDIIGRFVLSSSRENVQKNSIHTLKKRIQFYEIPNQYLVENLPNILELNPDIDVYRVPRVNTVKGITEKHIRVWGWRVNENGWINWPDRQMRIYKNTPEIKWESKVHETLVGFKTITDLPEMEELALYHPKTIEKQEKQNQLYNEL